MQPSLSRFLRHALIVGLFGAATTLAALPAMAQEEEEAPQAAPQEQPESPPASPENAQDDAEQELPAPAGQKQAAPPSQPQAQQQGAVRSDHGAWSIVCDQPAGAPAEQCALMQNVIAEDRPEVGLSVVVLKTADEQARILRVLAPLGVLLPNGLGLNVDGEDIGRAYFVRCFTDGCYAEVILEDELLTTLREGATATFIVFQTPEEGIGIPVELEGFAEGFDELP